MSPTPEELGVAVEMDPNGKLRVEAPQGLRLCLNNKGVEIANYLRHPDDPEFTFAKLVTMMSLECEDILVVQVAGGLTTLRIRLSDPYFL